MRKIIKRSFVILLIVFISINALFPNYIYASSIDDPLGNFFSVIIDGLLGIAIYPIKIFLMVPGVLISVLLKGGDLLVDVITTGKANGVVTLYDIFFNHVAITNINVFDIDGATGNIQTIRQSIAGFYIAFRNLAIVLSLAVLIYIGIQMAISNIAEQRAKYNQMLTNWIVGFGLIFILHYIIIITINANEMLVNALATTEVSASNIDNVLAQLKINAWLPSFTISITSIVIYVIFLVTTLIFLIIYIKRMITISFLVVIAPLISITYSIDKIDNNRSEILNTWIKEFMYNVLIQPFHCLIYLVFVGIAIDLLTTSGTIGDFGSAAFAIIFTFSIFLGQKIVREIFGFSQASSLSEKIAIFAMAKNVVGTAANIIAIKGAKNDKAAQARFKKLPVGQNANSQDYVAARVAAEQNRRQEEKAAKTSSTSGGASPTPPTPPPTRKTSGTSGTKRKRTIRDRFIHAPRPVKRVARFYFDMGKQLTGYNFVTGLRNQRRQKRVNHMTDEDYFIAASEMFRSGQTMSNEELAKKMEALYDETDINKLDPKALDYKNFIEHMKPNYTKDELVDLIINGTTDNRRWRA